MGKNSRKKRKNKARGIHFQKVEIENIQGSTQEPDKKIRFSDMNDEQKKEYFREKKRLSREKQKLTNDRIINFRTNEDIANIITKFSKKLNISKSEFIKLSIKEYSQLI